jgi:hypothetical protein
MLSWKHNLDICACPPVNNNMNMQGSLDNASAGSGLDGLTCQLALCCLVVGQRTNDGSQIQTIFI